MRVVAGWAEVDDLESYLETLAEIGATHGSVIQAVDARYVAGDAHLERATDLARRAIEAGETIADDPGMEMLLYVAGTRQIHQALDIGIDEGRQPIAIVIDGGEEAEATAAVGSLVESDEDVLHPDESHLSDWFDITPAERAATDASLEDLVCERVALLVLES